MFSALRPAFSGEIHTSAFMRRCYAGAAGIYAQRPRAVAFPRHAGDVRAAVLFCRERGLALTARGAGSGMAGNNVGRGLVLDVTRHLSRVVSYDRASGIVRVRPGLPYDALNEFLRPHGRFLPPNPSSGAFCTLGGMAASNASGMRSVKYGATAGWLAGIAGIWGTGEPFELQRPALVDAPHPGGGAAGSGDMRRKAPAAVEPSSDGVVRALQDLFRDRLPAPPPWLTRVAKNSAGLRVWPAWDGGRLDPIELLAGSEGTLAVFTEIALRTAPLPGGRSLVLASFATLDDLLRAVERVRPLGPSGVEFLDRTFLEPLRATDAGARAALPAAAETALFVELEGADPAGAARAAAAALGELQGLALPGARLAAGEAEMRGLWALRRGASPSLARLHPGRVTLQFVEDCAVPPARLPGLVAGLRRIFAEAGVPVVLFGHAGESHVHANPLFDPDDPALPEQVDRLAAEVCALVEALEGTLSGEHGDGLARAAFARRRFGEEATGFFAAVRRVCDPAGILNPGKVLPAPGWRTSRDLRYPWERRALSARARARAARDASSGQARGPGLR